ncbi:AAA family ATPase [Janibacter terrae]|uniref:AAA family ATPase n=1 Tax=Janibacter terrae TaxID=103817 RepID=UPI00381AB5C9
MFDVYHANASGEMEPLGSVKIGQVGYEGGGESIFPSGEVTALPDNCFSLGQSESYYQRLADLGFSARSSFTSTMRDIVANPDLLDKHLNEEVMSSSLLRSVSRSDVEGKLRDVLRGNYEPTYFKVVYTKDASTELEFEVSPTSRIGTNIHALIGKNGVGKTTILQGMALCLVAGGDHDGSMLAAEDAQGNNKGVFSGVQYVTWSPFDRFPGNEWLIISPGISMMTVGHEGVVEWKPGDFMGGRKESDDFTTTGPSDTFIRAVEAVRRFGVTDDWNAALNDLNSDPMFRELGVFEECKDANELQLGKFFEKLSDGHKVTLLTATHLAATLAERTLVILDEPEAHLHPPLLSALVRCLSNLLRSRNAVAVVATHSPVVLQEVLRSSVHIIDRAGDALFVRRPSLETFGEDVSVLTHEVFGLEVERAGFHAGLAKVADEANSFEMAMEILGGSVGSEGMAILRTMISSKSSHGAESAPW